MTVQHIVLFSFPRELSAGEAADMRAMVASWPEEIGLMGKCRLGTDLTGARARGYGYLLYTEFPGLDALNDYQGVRREMFRTSVVGAAPIAARETVDA